MSLYKGAFQGKDKATVRCTSFARTSVLFTKEYHSSVSELYSRGGTVGAMLLGGRIRAAY